ncbi:MAG: hypothetical protein WBB28_13820 [Crinalium sp.]
MSFDREVFYITESSLAEAFNLNPKDFDLIVEALTSTDNEEVRLKEWVHFIIQGYVNKRYPKRIFSKEGAIAIASYRDVNGAVDETHINTVFALLERYRINQIDATVRRSVYENSSSIALRRQRHWLNREDVMKILKTNKSRLEKAFQDIQRSDTPMIIDEDFENQDQVYYSLSGLEKLSLELSVSLRSEERREYCSRVTAVAPPVIQFLSLIASPSQEDVEKTVRYVKNKDKFCQVTGVARDKYENQLIKLVGHHLYDKNNYWFLADATENIITIAEQVSDDFHQWNGGFNRTCTIDDFIKYVEWRYPEKHEAILMLENRRKILLLKLRQLQRTLPKGD